MTDIEQDKEREIENKQDKKDIFLMIKGSLIGALIILIITLITGIIGL